MIKRKERPSEEINASSMADIAFLLLIFFLVTTTIASDKGITMFLPPYQPDQVDPPKLKDKNVFVVLINSKDKLLVEEELMNPANIKEACKTFLSNNGRDSKSSDNPQKAVVSIKADRGTTYVLYSEVLGSIKAAYYELRADVAGLTLEEYMIILNTKKQDRTPKETRLYDKAKTAYPLQISEAEPSQL